MTINSRGFSARKRDLIFDFARTHSFDFLAVEETFIADELSFKSLTSEWSGPAFFSPACGRSAGVSLFVSKRFDGQVVSWKRDSDGRVISVLVTHNNVNLNIVCVYAPTQPAQRNSFLQSLHKFFFADASLIICGDFNCYDSVCDKFGGNPTLSSQFSNLKSNFGLIDAWRFKHPRASQFSWFNSDLSIASRLDTFLISRSLRQSIQECEITPCTFSDHEFVSLDIDPSSFVPHGPGIWKFNNSLLSNEAFCQQIVSVIDTFSMFEHTFPSVIDFWEALKQDFKQLSIKFSRTLSRDRARSRVLLTNKLIRLKAALVAGNSSVKPAIFRVESELNAIYTQEMEGAKIRSRAQWLELGEAPSRYFFQLERERVSKCEIESVYNADGVEVFSHADISRAHVDFYSRLFSRDEIDNCVLDDLLSHVRARLSSAECDSCEGDIALNELTLSLKAMAHNKSPGPDGLSVEFYLTFWARLGPILVRVFNSCYSRGELSDSMKESATRLIFKKGDRKSLKNWRPISLLNVDYKICSKALSLRLSKVLGSVVSTDQTCSVPGRSIVSNLTLLRDTLDYISRTNETGILVSLDQEKAFDRVDRSFLLKLLSHLGFGPSFCHWIAMLYSGAFMRIIVNGYLSDRVNLCRGVRQGDSLSPMLYILCVEVLACKIRDSPDIIGFSLPGADGRQFKVGQYADDTTSFVKDARSFHALFREIRLYERGTGAKLNLSKTEAMWLGSWRGCPDQPLGLTWVTKMKILGVVFSSGLCDVSADNWEPRLSKLEKSLNLWKSRSLSLVGKSLIINTLGISKLIYVSQVLVPPRWVIDRLNKLIWPFLWGSKIETVSRHTVFCHARDGGLGLVNFSVKAKAVRLACLLRVLDDPSCACFYLARYFCGSRLSRLRPEWASLRDNRCPSAFFPSSFYSECLAVVVSLRVPSVFVFSSKSLYEELRKVRSSTPPLHYHWKSLAPASFSIKSHWRLVRGSFAENFKNDLFWLIALKAVKVRDSLCRWGYIKSPVCASCPRRETIDHCFLHCNRVKLVWSFFLPLLTSFVSPPRVFVSNVPSVFFFESTTPSAKHKDVLIYLIQTIIYAVWKFRNRATFYNGRDDHRAIIKFVLQDVKFRLRCDFVSMSRTLFYSRWVFPGLCQVVGDKLTIALP